MGTKGTSTSKIPDGTWGGNWGGYVATVSIRGETYKITTVDGIRTPSTPCIVRVSGDSITVTAT